MKKPSTVLLIICTVFFLGTVAYRFYPKENFAMVQIKKRLIDIGERKPHDQTFVIFEMENIGESSFIISDVQADCHCTVPKWTQELVEKGGIAKIHVSYSNDQLGYFQQNITVSCNVENSPIILTLRGKTVIDK